MYISVLCWQLPTKLAEWTGESLQEALGFPDKTDTRARQGTGWTPDKLNHYKAHIVDGALTTFGCVEWESELTLPIQNAKASLSWLQSTGIHSFEFKYIPVHTLTLPVCTSTVSTYWYILVQTAKYLLF